MTQENVTQLQRDKDVKSPSLIEKIGGRFGVDPNKLLSTLKATAFKQRNGPEPTNEQMMALLVVADQYKLNPFTREIYAFPDKQNGIVPVVGVDGWSRIINSHPDFDGMEFRFSEEEVCDLPGMKHAAPKWCECVMHRKDRSHPIAVPEYLDEVYRKPFESNGRTFDGPWQTHTRRFLRHKAMIQAARIAFGFVGIYDEDEAQRIIDVTPQDQESSSRPERKDFVQKATDVFTLIDEFGDTVGEFSEQDYVERTVSIIENIKELRELQAFQEFNEETQESFPPRSEARKAIAGAYNAARERLGPDQGEEPRELEGTPEPAGEPAEGWEDWTDRLCATIGELQSKGGLDNVLNTHKAQLNILKAEAPALHTSILNAVNTRLGEVTARQNQE